MKTYSLVLTSLWSLLCLFLLYGCSDESSSTQHENNVLYLSGKVSDPAVAGAKIELLDSKGSILARCGVNGNTVCNVWSRQDGSFSFALPKNTDYTSYILKTHGGKDTQYGYDIEYSLSRSLSSNNEGALMVTPVTSLIRELSVILKNESKAEETIMKSLNLQKKELYYDAESSINILKASYLINAVISVDTKDSIKTVGDVAKVLQNGSKLEDKKTLGLLITNPAKLQEIENIILSLNKITSSGLNVEQAVKEIKKIEKHRMFSLSVMGITSQNELSEQAHKNIDYLILYIEKKLVNDASIPLEQFTVDQIMKYIALIGNKQLSLYDSYNVTLESFKKTLENIVNTTPDFAQQINNFIAEKVYNINIPVDNPLGMDNQQRLEYYFNSTKDLNYKARQLTKNVLDDLTNESIYSTIINNYASYGFVERAEKYTNINIKDTLLRMSKLSDITLYASKMYPSNKNIRLYVDKAYKDMQDFNKTNPEVSEKYLNPYMSFLRSYASIKDTKKIETIKTEIYEKLTKYPEKPQSGPSRYTLYSRVYNSLGNVETDSLIYQVINDNNLNEAYRLLEIRKEAIDDAKNITTNIHLNPELTGYMAQLNMIIHFYNKDENKQYTAKLKNMVNNIKDSMLQIREQTLSNTQIKEDIVKYYYQTAFVSLADALNYVVNDEKSALEVYKMIDPDLVANQLFRPQFQKAKKDAASALFKGKSLQYGFDTGIKFFEKEMVLGKNYENLIDDYVTHIVGMTATAEYDGFVYAALRNNKSAEAVKALDYIYNKMAYALKNSDTASYLPQNVKSKLISYSLSKSTDAYAKYITSGITALAKGYIVAGDNKKAIKSLKLADVYLDTLQDSLAKYDYNMALSYMAQQAGSMELSNKYYNNAIQIDNPQGASQEQLAFLHILKAVDSDYLNVENKLDIAKNNLPKAEELIKNIQADSDRINQAHSDYYILTAKAYYHNSMIDKAKQMLILADEKAGAVNSGPMKMLYYERIMKAYTYCELIDEGYEKAVTLVKDVTNRNRLIKALVTEAAKKTDFKNTDIATVDTDKDGKPDFFYPWVTEEDKIKHKLELDDDIDGDGINDNEDTLPYVKNK